ncbi:TSC22 domain family protein 1-like [Coregonus clupeaformis]|uniref:TSC22 domain family protein 1-like n=1 Tax=Coregonus clupeaformis TaxID=59861 RepID=UPI001E1C690F|nr:TSC22 domain family protein 1-like [Coregonus clupeaformis]
MLCMSGHNKQLALVATQLVPRYWLRVGHKMHQQDFSGDSTGSRKMSFHNRRGSNTTGSGGVSGSAAGSSNVIPTDDYQSTSQAGSSCPGPHHHPQSLNLSQPGAQVKKKSGFQITSVTLAQVSVSTNNSIADDTESYDDMDESHTEDLSSSEMLDVSVSRDTGVPERSSSDETLNSPHGVETPGAASPNQPLIPHSLPQGPPSEPLQPRGPPQPGNMVNGTVHNLQENVVAAAFTVSVAGGSSSGMAGPNQTQMGQGMVENTTTQFSGTITAGPGMDVSSIDGGSGVPPSADPISFDSSGGRQGTSSGVGSLPGGTGPTNSTQIGMAGVVAQAMTSSTQTQTQAAPGSRFRVVKLDSNSEPFRKGRWMCTEYYEKEVPPAAPTSDPAPAPSAAGPESEAWNGSVVASVVQYGGPEMEAWNGSVVASVDQYGGPEMEAGNGSVVASVVQYGGPEMEAGNGSVVASVVQYGGPEMEAGNGSVVASVVQYGGPEMEAGNGSVVASVVQYGGPEMEAGASQTLQPYQQHQDYTSPQTVHMVPQDPNPLLLQQTSMVPPGTLPAAPQGAGSQAMPQQVPYAMDHAQTGQPTQQLPAVLVSQTGSRPPDFIQPTAPLQSQVLPPHPGSLGVSMPGPAAVPQPLPSQLQNLPAQQLHPHPQHPSAPFVTTLRADLQPLLTHGVPLSHTSLAQSGAPYGGSIPSLTASQLEDAQRLLFQHQSRLTLPRLGAAGGGCSMENMGKAGDASALVAAAAGLRTQSADGEEDSSSGASLVAIDNKIEQAMDLVKSHLMYAVREEVDVLKDQIKELIERNSQLEQENNLLKTLASPEQMAQFQAQVQPSYGSPNPQPQPLPSSQSSGTSA